MIIEYEIIKENNFVKLVPAKKININNNDITIDDVVNILNKYYNFNKLNIENSFLAAFDNQANLIGLIRLSIGNQKQCFFYKHSVITCLVLLGAMQFAYFHNHTCDNLIIPSENDISTYYDAHMIANLMDISFIDSIIVNNNDYYSIGEYEKNEKNGTKITF